MINSCSWIMDNDEPCGNICEGKTAFCSSHNRQLRKESSNEKKSIEKRNSQIAKAQKRNQEPRKTISKNPADWSNTFLCSDGERVTQAEINQMYSGHVGRFKGLCEGCQRKKAVCNAHIIARARCKQIGKTELIWDSANMFDACWDCNRAIEIPKGNAWKQLKNINTYLSFIQQHDKELFAKFESRLATIKPTI